MPPSGAPCSTPRALLAEHGSRPTISAVAARAGLARPSVYQYFDSADAILDALVEDVFPRWSERVAAAMAGAATPADAVLAYVRTSFELVAEGEHALATALAEIAPGHAIAEKTRRMHEQLLEPLTAVLAALAVEAVHPTAEMVNAVVHAGARLIESGTPLEVVWRSAHRLLAPFAGAAGAKEVPERPGAGSEPSRTHPSPCRPR